MANGTMINYAHLEALEVDGGSGANVFTVNNTPNGPDQAHMVDTTINTGNGGDTTDV